MGAQNEETMNLEAILNRKLESLFPDVKTRAKVINTLKSYGVERYEQEPTRVRLAILKLSGNDPDQIQANTRYAKEDFRDVLMWAEYRRQGGKWSTPNGPKKQKLSAVDRLEYEDWLRE